MPKFTNKSARIFHFSNGMCGPGHEVELDQKEVESPYVQSFVEPGELVQSREARKQEAQEEKGTEAAAKAQATASPHQPRKV